MSQTSIATSSSGSYAILQGGNVQVYAPSMNVPTTIHVTDEEPKPGFHLGISPDAKHLVVVQRAGLIECWSVAAAQRLWVGRPSEAIARRFEQPVSGGASPEPISFGPPLFVDDETFVTHHQGGIVVWSIGGPAPLKAISDPRITIARLSFAVDAGERLVLVCSSNQLEIANASPLVVSTKEARVVDRLAGGYDFLIGAEQRGSVLAFGDDKKVRIVRGETCVVYRPPSGISAFTLDELGQHLVWAADGAVTVETLDDDVARAWRFDAAELGQIARVWAFADQLSAIAHDGKRKDWRRSDGMVVPPTPMTVIGAGEQKYEQAVLAFSVGDGGSRLLDPSAYGADHLIAGVFFDALDGGADLEEVEQAWREAGVDFRADATREAFLHLASALTDVQQAVPAGNAFWFWLRTNCTADGIQTGLRLLALFDEGELPEMRSVIVEGLARSFPDDDRVRIEAQRDGAVT